jgi:hypothetical protein
MNDPPAGRQMTMNDVFKFRISDFRFRILSNKHNNFENNDNSDNAKWTTRQQFLFFLPAFPFQVSHEFFSILRHLKFYIDSCVVKRNITQPENRQVTLFITGKYN